jgi:hypothetical protein
LVKTLLGCRRSPRWNTPSQKEVQKERTRDDGFHIWLAGQYSKQRPRV